MTKGRRLAALLLCLALLLGLFSGCGGSGGEPEVKAEAFYGCWEYQDYYVWVDIRDDGTYEWVDGDNASSGSYTMEEDELVLDNGLRLARLKIGGLIDSDGNALFRSELPVSFGSDPGDGGYTGSDPGDGGYTGSDPGDGGHGDAVYSAEDYCGCWWRQDEWMEEWLYIYGDGTYEWRWDDGLRSPGSYSIEDGVLCLSSGSRFTLNEYDELVNLNDGTTMEPTDTPDFW